jgi:POT family proton-dependent oligopeptide transporter
LPSQIQSLNSVFVLTFIPIFAFFIYPWVEKFWPLSSLRKMAIGFILMAASFVLVSLIQENIDGGGRPNIAWQIGAFALLTAAEIMVSIVALEFAYTQAPKTMKSFIMCFYLAAVAVGNFLVAGVNHYIRIPSAAEEQLADHLSKLPDDWQESPRTVVLTGYDKSDHDDTFIRRLNKDAVVPLEVPGQETLDRAADAVISAAEKSGAFPDKESGGKLIAGFRDHWGRPLRYLILNSTTVRLWSAGGDGKWNTKWDIGIDIARSAPEPESKASWMDNIRPGETWLSLRKKELGIKQADDGGVGETFSKTNFSGGQVRLQGAAYFWFFSGLMGATAILFIPFAMIYRPKSYLQDQ